MFKTIKQGLFKTVSLPSFGKQDVGITPGGAMDVFALQTGNVLLGNPDDAPALEILFPPTLEFGEDCYFVLTGSANWGSKLSGTGKETYIRHGKVYLAKKGSVLSFGKKHYGFRTYLCYRAAGKAFLQSPEGRERGAFGDMAQWTNTEGYIRVVEGPEYSYLKDKELFLKTSWMISSKTSDMGMRLENPDAPLSVSLGNIVSEAVATGTVQLTPKGPIILLKNRQTVGGYPRIFNVISADTDMLGQYMPGQKLHFKKVPMEEAVNILRQQKDDIEKLRKRLNSEE